MSKLIIKSALFALTISLVSAGPTLAAYVDPNTGGLLFQLLAVLFLFFSGIVLFLSRYIRMALARARRYLSGLFNSSTVTNTEK